MTNAELAIMVAKEGLGSHPCKQTHHFDRNVAEHGEDIQSWDKEGILALGHGLVEAQEIIDTLIGRLEALHREKDPETASKVDNFMQFIDKLIVGPDKGDMMIKALQVGKVKIGGKNNGPSVEDIEKVFHVKPTTMN